MVEISSERLLSNGLTGTHRSRECTCRALGPPDLVARVGRSTTGSAPQSLLSRACVESAACFQVEGRPRPVISSDQLARMTDVMGIAVQRPWFYRTNGAALGVRRLSIIDVVGGHQPFSNQNGSIWAIQNGELYNHEEIRKQLLVTVITSQAVATRRCALSV